MKKLLRVAVVDDYVPAMENIVRHLKYIPDIEVVVAETNSIEFIIKCHLMKEPPDVIFVDYFMTEIDGITILDYFNFFHPTTKCICVSGCCSQTILEEVFSAGAMGFICKILVNSESLELAIANITNNTVFLHFKELEPKLIFTEENALKIREQNSTSILSKKSLTKREKLFAILNTTGLSYKEIASLLYVEVRTVETTCYRLSQKAGVKGGRRNLLLSALKKGWVKMANSSPLKRDAL